MIHLEVATVNNNFKTFKRYKPRNGQNGQNSKESRSWAYVNVYRIAL